MGHPANPVPMTEVGIHPKIPNLEPTTIKPKKGKKKTNSITVWKYKERIKQYANKIKNYQEIIALYESEDKDMLLIPKKIFEILEKHGTNQYNVKIFNIYSIKRLSELTGIIPRKVEKYLELISYIKGNVKIYSKVLQFHNKEPKQYYSLGSLGKISNWWDANIDT